MTTFQNVQIVRRLVCAVLVATLGFVGVGCATTGSGRWDAAAMVRVLGHDLNPPGAAFELARYGVANPACWTRANVPLKAGRRMRRLIAQGVSKNVRMCQLEYVRRGTHDDILVKVFLLESPAAAREALRTPFVKGRRKRLSHHGLPPPLRIGNVLYYVIGSATNHNAIRKVHSALRTCLTRGPQP